MILGVEAGKRLQIKEIHPRGFPTRGNTRETLWDHERFHIAPRRQYRPFTPILKSGAQNSTLDSALA